MKSLIGLFLLPLCWVSVETFFLLFREQARSGAFYRHPAFFFFAAGLGAFLLVFLLCHRSRLIMWCYVAAHELTHAVFVLLCRGEVRRIHITPEGGHILTNRSNFLILLSPYFVPFYTVAAILLWSVLEWLAFDFSPSDRFWLYGIIGFTWMFHVVYTIRILRREQADIRENGGLFSFSVILLANVLITSALLILATPTASFGEFARDWSNNFLTLGDRLSESVREIASGTFF